MPLSIWLPSLGINVNKSFSVAAKLDNKEEMTCSVTFNRKTAGLNVWACSQQWCVKKWVCALNV